MVNRLAEVKIPDGLIQEVEWDCCWVYSMEGRYSSFRKGYLIEGFVHDIGNL